MRVQGISVLVIFAMLGTMANARTTFHYNDDSGESDSSVEVQHGGGGDDLGYQHYAQEGGPQLFEKDEEGEQQGDFDHNQGGYHGFGQEDSGSFSEDEGYGGNAGGYDGHHHGGGDESEEDVQGGKGY